MTKIATALVTALVLASAVLTGVANAAPRGQGYYGSYGYGAPVGDSLRDTRGGSGF